MGKQSLPNQLTLSDPLEYSLRQAFEKFHRRASHKTSYVKSVRTALAHWERCTSDPPLRQCGNGVMSEFAAAFMRSPLPSKVACLMRQAKRGETQARHLLASIGCAWESLQSLSPEGRYRRVASADPVPKSLLPSTVTFNAQRRAIEAIFSTLGPPHRGNRYALGLLPEVPCCRPEEEDDPEIVFASEGDLNAIYDHCRVATWPSLEATGVDPADLWRALFVYLYNVASRRGDFLRLDKSRVRLTEGLILSKQGKSRKQRAVPINAALVRHLRTIWHGQSPLMFPFPKNGRDLYRQWYAIQDAAGIRLDRSAGSVRKPYYGFHEIRKTSLGEYFALNEHASQEMGAHSALATTLKHYVGAAKRTGKLRQAVEALPQPTAFLGEEPTPPPPAPQPPSGGPRLRIVG